MKIEVLVSVQYFKSKIESHCIYSKMNAKKHIAQVNRFRQDYASIKKKLKLNYI